MWTSIDLTWHVLQVHVFLSIPQHFKLESETAAIVRLSVLWNRPVLISSHERSAHNTDRVPKHPQTIDSPLHFRCNPTLGPHQPSQPPLRPLQHPNLPSRVPSLTGSYWSWHTPSDYDVFYDSLDGSFIVLVAASGFWWWTWWGQRGGSREEREARARRDTRRTIEEERGQVMG